MRFYQYATGRASIQGYGFVAQTQGITFDNSLFQRGRDLSLMPEGSVVYELHGIDPLHTALIMTRVNAFGSGRYCYSHALITEQAAEPGVLARLLQPQAFLDNQGFLALEAAKARGEAFSSKELELPQATQAREQLLREFEDKKDVWYGFLGYLWHLCYLRSQGAETLQPAILVLPREWPTAKVIQFYTDCILPALPGDMRHHASVVIGASPRCFGEFPSNTTCLILQERADNLIPMFDLNSGVKISSDAYTNDLVSELGKSMDGDAYPLTRLHRRQLQGLPPSSVNDFGMAYAFQHLDRLAAQKKKSMALYHQFFLGRYRELAGMVRNRYDVMNYRSVLLETERTSFLYWREVNQAGEDSPPELYADLVQKALTTTDESLWQQYLAVLGQPCRLADNEYELAILLGQGRWKLSEDKRTLEQLNPQRFALLLSGHLKQADAAVAQTLLKSLTRNTLDSQQLRRAIAAIIQQQLPALQPKGIADMLESPVWQADERADILRKCDDVKLAQALLTCLSKKTLEDAALRKRLSVIIQKNIQSLEQSELNSILASPVWQDTEKTDIIIACMTAWGKPNDDPRNALAVLCPLLKNHPYAKGVPVLLECAQSSTLNAVEADRLAETLVIYANEVKAKHAPAVLALFKEEHHRHAISLLLRDLFKFDYDRSKAPLWAEVENSLVSQAFTSELRAAEAAEDLLQVGRSWSVKAQKVHHYEWPNFLQVIPQAESDVRRASQALIERADIAELSTLDRGTRDDWFGKIVKEEMSNHLQQHISTMLTNPQNFNQMDLVVQLAEHVDSKLTSGAEFEVIRMLSDLRGQKPFELLTKLDSLCDPMSRSGLGSYIRHRAKTIRPDTLAWEIVYELLVHWGDSRTAWDAFFKGHAFSPEPKTSPWKDDLYPMIALRHVCKCMVDGQATRARKEELMRFVTTAPAWSRYVRLMENKREHKAFVRDDKIATPSLGAWLALHLVK